MNLSAVLPTSKYPEYLFPNLIPPYTGDCEFVGTLLVCRTNC